MLFLGAEGKIAVAFEEKNPSELNIGDSPYIFTPFEELTEEEQHSFIYPVSYERVTQ